MDAPIQPDEADCCNSGCSTCILDVYQEQLHQYKAQKGSATLSRKNCISKTSYAVFKLIEKIPHTKDTVFLIFEYSRPFRKDNNVIGTNIDLYFKPGQHFLMRSPNGRDHYTRAYTPIPFDNLSPLHFCVLVKIYKEGLMSRHWKKLEIAWETLWRGPYCDFEVSYQYKTIFMIAQGTGIAPLYAIIKDILLNEDCETTMKLYFCCRSCDDILLREELYECASYWNFTYEVFASTFNNFNGKYNEVIHGRRLERADVISYLRNKNNCSTQVLICGDETFAKCISDYLTGLDEVNVFIF